MEFKIDIPKYENGFIFNPATGDSFSGNSIASEIILAMKTGTEAEQIKQDILLKYEVTLDQLDRDWEDWMVQLKEANLLEI